MKLRHPFTCLLLVCSLASANAEENIHGRWTVWSAQPATRWEDAFVTGNGTHGTLVWGQDGADERITMVHEELFLRGWDPAKQTVAKTAHLLPEVRALINENKNNEADALITSEAERQLQAMGAKQRWPLIPHPAFDLRIRRLDAPDATAADNAYRRCLDMERGLVTVSRTGDDGMQEEVFSSRTHNVNVVRLTPARGKTLDISLWLEETPGREGEHFEHSLDSAFRSIRAEADPKGWLCYRAAYRNTPGGYTGLARVVNRGGSIIQDGRRLNVRGADEVLLLVRITPEQHFGQERPIDKTRHELGALPADFAKLLAPHAEAHGRMFRRMQLDLGCADQWQSTPIEQMLADIDRKGTTPLFMEQIHAMGRYLLISSCGSFPPPLQGIWGGGWKPAWIGGFVWDSNINLAISAAAMSNLPECAETYCSHIERNLLAGWRLNAANYLGCRGFLVAHYNDPLNGYLTHFGPGFPWMGWAGGAGWNLRPFYEYAMMTGDKKMLHRRVLPLYREMAQFYEDFLVMENDSLYHILPSVSPENAVQGTYTWFSRDATMDVAIAREVFSLLLTMDGITPDERRKYEHYLGHLPAYRINGDGALAEWVDARYPDIYDHRHLSHLYPVFPGSQLRKDKGEPALRRAAKVALDKRFAFDTGSAHGLIHVALQAARLGDIGKITTNLDRFSRRHYVYNSLVTSHDPNHNVYNLDAVLSLPRLFMEMLVYTEPGRIELLPAWPETYADGSLQGVRLFGGHTLTLAWEKGRLKAARLKAGSSETLTVDYRGRSLTMKLKKGKTYPLVF